MKRLCMRKWQRNLLSIFSSRRLHTILTCDWSSDVCSSDLRTRSKNFRNRNMNDREQGTGNREPGTGNGERGTPPCSNFPVSGFRFPVPGVDVIVVTWNARPYLEELVRGLCVVDYPRDAFTVHIVDNASSDGSADYVKSVLANPPENLPKVVLHEPGSNTC